MSEIEVKEYKKQILPIEDLIMMSITALIFLAIGIGIGAYIV